MNEENIKNSWKVILNEIGEDIDREGLLDTPKRIAKMYKELFTGYDKNKLPEVTTFNNGHDGIVYDEMITDEGDFYSQCEHHVIPFFGRYFFSYIPNKKGKILGLSKVGRVVDYFSAKLQVQERLTHEIINYIWIALSKCKNKPLAMGLRMEGEHLCKTMRGVKKKGKMTTTCLLGTFKTDSMARGEFMSWVNKR